MQHNDEPSISIGDWFIPNNRPLSLTDDVIPHTTCAESTVIYETAHAIRFGVSACYELFLKRNTC